jgi:hypothetical protein
MLLYKPVNAVRKILAKHRLINAGLTGIAAFTLVGLLTNDAGVVMAATGLLYLVFPLILLVESERCEGSHPPELQMHPIKISEYRNSGEIL